MKINAERVKELKKYADCKDVEIKKKVSMLMQHYSGIPNKQIASFFNCSVRTIERYVEKFETGGFDAIQPKSFKKPKKLNDLTKSEIENDVLQNPYQFSLPYTIWNARLLQYHINSKYSIKICEKLCAKILNTDICKSSRYRIENYKCHIGNSNDRLRLETNQIVQSVFNENSYLVWLASFVFLTYHKNSTGIKLRKLEGYKENIGALFYSKSCAFEDVYESVKSRDKNTYVRALSELIIQESLPHKKVIVILESKREYLSAASTLIQTLSPNQYNYQIVFLPKDYILISDYDYNTYQLGLIDSDGQPKFLNSLHLSNLVKKKIRKQYEELNITTARLLFTRITNATQKVPLD